MDPIARALQHWNQLDPHPEGPSLRLTILFPGFAPVACMRRSWPIAALLLAAACNRDEVSHYRAPKENPAVAGSSQSSAPMGMPSSSEPPSDMGSSPGSEAPPRPAGKAALKWTLPKGWTEGEAGGMRYATLKPPFPGKLEATVVVLAGTAGGEVSNVNRWRGQIGLPPIEEKDLPALRKIVKTKAGMVAVFDFTSEGQTKSRMVAGLLSTPDGNTWFMKLVGDSGPVAQAQPDFMHFLGSLRFD